jgi:hypothetical protein
MTDYTLTDEQKKRLTEFLGQKPDTECDHDKVPKDLNCLDRPDQKLINRGVTDQRYIHESQFAARDLMIAALEKRCEALDRIITQDTEREIALKQQNVDVAHLFNFKVEEASRYRKALEEIQVETYEVETEQRCAKALETKSGSHACIVPPGSGDPICSICGRNTQGQAWGGKP